ncbi:MAG TPA: glycosyltransferase family 1 protein [Gammaproteobacteria bacterium]|nr:glycosyltransferase family 1 protein [Gammaproteobacteria bacterium]
MKIAIVTDAWKPQVNGVVRTLARTGEELQARGYRVCFVTPQSFTTVPCPTYPSIRLALWPGRRLADLLDRCAPTAVHIATEGPLGLAARAYCRSRGLAFTSSYHTQFPEYVRLRAPVPLALSYRFLRWFHGAARRTLVATPSMRRQLVGHGFRNVVIWSRGVDTELFRPRAKDYLQAPRPIAMYVGRVAVEKNIEAFLALDLPGTRYVVGDGPDLDTLRRRHPQVRFTGFKFGEELARHLAAADVFVFPSRTDTFGLVMLEAMACGVPVAAYPVTGPVDVVREGVTGVLDEDLRRATLQALELSARACRAYALEHTWRTATRQFLEHLELNAQTARAPA